MIVGTAIAIVGALAGYGYWALVAMSSHLAAYLHDLRVDGDLAGFRECHEGGLGFVP